MTYRVIQWATGAMGTAILRTMLDHPGIEVVGTYVYGEAKAGRDIGDLARRDATGVLVTRLPATPSRIRDAIRQREARHA